MGVFTDYIDESLKYERDSFGIKYKYQRHILEEMTERANSATEAGLTDPKVISDLVISNYKNIKYDYKKYYIKELRKLNAKKFRRTMYVLSPLAVLTSVAAMLLCGFFLHIWASAWLIPLGVIFSLIITVNTAVAIEMTRRSIWFNVIARVLNSISIMLISVFLFLVLLMDFHFKDIWTVIPMGVATIFVADCFYIHFTKKKFRVVNYLIYIPILFTMLFVILGGLELVPFKYGWILIIISLVVDLIVALIKVNENNKYYKSLEVQNEK